MLLISVSVNTAWGVMTWQSSLLNMVSSNVLQRVQGLKGSAAVLQYSPDDLDTKVKLAHAYEDSGNPARALELVNEGEPLKSVKL